MGNEKNELTDIRLHRTFWCTVCCGITVGFGWVLLKLVKVKVRELFFFVFLKMSNNRQKV